MTLFSLGEYRASQTCLGLFFTFNFHGESFFSVSVPAGREAERLLFFTTVDTGSGCVADLTFGLRDLERDLDLAVVEGSRVAKVFGTAAGGLRDLGSV